ncbi:MAG: hypothetical protein DRQ24_07660, partial [Candidatus Latescibacterota bacterium]
FSELERFCGIIESLGSFGLANSFFEARLSAGSPFWSEPRNRPNRELLRSNPDRFQGLQEKMRSSASHQADGLCFC